MSNSAGDARTLGRGARYQEVSDGVIMAVADAENVSPLELSPLTHAVDPDALNNLVESLQAKQTDCAAYIEFEYMSHRVTVDADGDISIE